MRGHWIVVLEQWVPNTTEDRNVLPRDFFVGGTSYPPHGRLPIALEDEPHPEDCSIKVGEDHFILLRDTFEEAFKFSTEDEAKRMATSVGGTVEFIP